jgi:EAL domain-containing protein (putative c-di-GMP-specific phosphodiesterase class I)
VEDYKALVEALDAVRDTGGRVAVDDTGAGWTGLAHILRLRLDIVKLDTVRTSRIHADPVRRALVASFFGIRRARFDAQLSIVAM